MIEQQYITVAEAARILGVTPRTILNWVQDHRVKHLSIHTVRRGTHLIDRADFQRFIQAHTVEAKPPRKAGRPRTQITTNKEVQ
jgi:excisionase family DNA binding protein